MNYKKILAYIAYSLFAFILFTGCKGDDDGYKEVDITPVDALYDPADGRILNLYPTGSSIYFEWQKAEAQDNGLVYYDVLFDKLDGDFSNPVYILTADNRGTSTGASVEHKILNRIARLAGTESGELGTLKWTVRSSRGLTKKISKDSREVSIVRLSGIDPPDELYITGEASEGGSDLKKAMPFKMLDDGFSYEIYTSLAIDAKYQLTDSKKYTSRTFSIYGDSIAEDKDINNSNGGKVEKEGIYRIRLHFLTQEVEMVELAKVGFFLSNSNAVTNTFNYTGFGKWELVNYNIKFFNMGGWFEDRYKFQFEYADGTIEHWGQANYNDNRPKLSDANYFRMGEVQVNRDNGAFKFAEDFFDAGHLDKSYADITITMTGTYTHHFENLLPEEEGKK